MCIPSPVLDVPVPSHTLAAQPISNKAAVRRARIREGQGCCGIVIQELRPKEAQMGHLLPLCGCRCLFAGELRATCTSRPFN